MRRQFSPYFAVLDIETQQQELRKAQDAVAEQRERRRKQQQSLSVLTSEVEQVKTALAKLRSGTFVFHPLIQIFTTHATVHRTCG